LTIYDSTFFNNTAAGGKGGKGGAAVNLGVAGDLGAAGSAQGAALFNDAGSVMIINSTFSNNSGTGAAGIRGFGLTNSIVAQNGSTGGAALGGGVFNGSGTLFISACQFLGNSLVGGAGGDGGTGIGLGLNRQGGDGGDGGAALGGGIYNGAVAATVVTNSTFSDNVVTGGTGGTGGQGGGLADRAPSGQNGAEAGAEIFNAGGLLQFLISLSIQPLGKEIQLTWPGVGDFTLQFTVNPASLNSWTTVTNQPTRTSGLNTLRIGATNPAGFYRLFSQ
jgi:hypothetical protein